MNNNYKLLYRYLVLSSSYGLIRSCYYLYGPLYEETKYIDNKNTYIFMEFIVGPYMFPRNLLIDSLNIKNKKIVSW